MALIQVYAVPASFEDGMMSIKLSLVAPAPAVRFESNKVDEIVAQMEAFRDEQVAKDPAQGLYVSARVVSGRKPNGFKKIDSIKYQPA